jgi:hypothetical protein
MPVRHLGVVLTPVQVAVYKCQAIGLERAVFQFWKHIVVIRGNVRDARYSFELSSARTGARR